MTTPQRTNASWLYLSGALALVSVLLLISLGLLWFSHTRCVDARKTELALTQQNTTQQQRYRNLQLDEPLFRQNLAKLAQFEQHGIIGNEARADWITHLRSIAKSSAAQNLEYELSPQRPLQTAGDEAINKQHYQLYGSAMQLKAEVLHEGHFLTLLAGIQTTPQAWPLLRECALQPSVKSANIDLDTSPTLLRLTCQLEWLSLKPPSAPTP